MRVYQLLHNFQIWCEDIVLLGCFLFLLFISELLMFLF
jgi:hypothetical protein